MDPNYYKLFENLIPSTYVKQASDAANANRNVIRHFLQHKKIPENGWDNNLIEKILSEFSLMDSNNFPSQSGVGEREARIASELVARRHYNFGHGIGRSGNLTEVQPKAAGSSILYTLTNSMLKDLMKLMGIHNAVECLLIPVATGMSLIISMLTFRSVKPKAVYVIWSRIDQKSCFKSIVSLGFIPIIIDMIKQNDELISDCKTLEEKILEIGVDQINCVISTTSCFAPRSSDNIESIAEICKKYDLFHLVNNAYGLQSKYLMNRIRRANIKGKLDIFVQSTDKNLMVPVGGAIIASFDKTLLEKVANIYPGRASGSPIIDVFITLLSLGKNGYLKLVNERENLHEYLKENLEKLASKYAEDVMDTPGNPISLAFTLKNVPKDKLTELGSMLFLRNVSGCRVVTIDEIKSIDGFEFKKWGTHTDMSLKPYLTAAAAIGCSKDDINIFIGKLDKLLEEIYKENCYKHMI